jgi:hypothetical protein
VSRHFDEPLRPLPLGFLHPPKRCTFCGTQGPLRRTVLRATIAEAAVCLDVVDCMRRRKRKADREAA